MEGTLKWYKRQVQIQPDMYLKLILKKATAVQKPAEKWHSTRGSGVFIVSLNAYRNFGAIGGWGYTFYCNMLDIMCSWVPYHSRYWIYDDLILIYLES